MRFAPVVLRFLQLVGGDTPLADRCLPAQHEPGDTSAIELLKIGSLELSAAVLWVHQSKDFLIELPDGQRCIAVLLPPGGEEIYDCLPTRIVFFGLAHSPGRVLTTKRKQWVAAPATPLRKASERKPGL
jgi:hypothetical protein